MLHDAGRGECLHLASRRGCGNVLTRRRRRKNAATATHHCGMNFLPLVYASSSALSPTQTLTCFPDQHQARRCRKTTFNLPTSSTMNNCNVLLNNKQCELGGVDESRGQGQNKMGDRAVLIVGGWNQISLRRHQVDGALLMLRMLRRNGFRKRNLRIFVANGLIKTSGRVLFLFLLANPWF